MDLIVAVDKNWGIGYEGTQPFVIPADRKFFREKTAGSAVIVGRKTLADFPGGKPLKNRYNIVMSANRELVIDGAEIVHSIEELARLLNSSDFEKVFVIGGDSIYKMLMPYCRYAYVTNIDAAPPADRFFENLDKSLSWRLDEKGEIQEHEGIKYSFDRYENLDVKTF